jgi:putative FmdB family regulatory protein
MPTYEYECSNGHQFETVQRITEEPLERCTICTAKATRLISQTNFILKGGGWYADGYGKSKGGKESSSSKSTSNESGKSDTSSTTSESSSKKSSAKSKSD